ncbi:hypothetical protein AM571_PA00116 (plasmid) [Rhizobium etli 8C-3]|uniref:Uncharacterized protein n=1 Tax=Rhizobium etli 8C-3 TaxID=538025 RepID=A0A1L5PA92_RHIET|nr:hypothetical protein AM571_PA00116 [Rhizobium etli 8C-3]
MPSLQFSETWSDVCLDAPAFTYIARMPAARQTSMPEPAKNLPDLTFLRLTRNLRN